MSNDGILFEMTFMHWLLEIIVGSISSLFDVRKKKVTLSLGSSILLRMALDGDALKIFCERPVGSQLRFSSLSFVVGGENGVSTSSFFSSAPVNIIMR